MGKKLNSVLYAETKDELSANVDVTTSSPNNANTHVVRSSLKVVVSEYKKIDKELEIEYPIYLYFQDENCNNELIMLTKDCQIKVKHEYFSLVIEKSKSQMIYEHYITNNITTKEHFLDVYNEALKSIANSVV